MASNTLFPPIIDSTMPAFPFNTSAKVSFNLSGYNSFNDISGILYTLVFQKSNKTALNSSVYEMAQVFLPKASIQESNNIYSFEIPTSIPKGGFVEDTFYKMQIRLVAAGHAPGSSSPSANWITTNLDNISEWSTVCILKSINKPVLSNFTLNGQSAAGTLTLTSPILTIIGNLQFKDSNNNIVNGNDSLDSYYFKVASLLSWTSETYYSDILSPNSINQILKKQITDNSTYTISITYKTKFGYENTEQLFTFKVSYNTIAMDMSYNNDWDNGRITLTIPYIESQNAKKVMRSSIKDNYTSCEEVITYSDEEESGITVNDYTVEAGVAYKYSVLVDNKIYNKTAIVVADSEDMFLYEQKESNVIGYNEGRQLKIAFDNKVSSYNIKFSDSSYDTLGGKYPIIVRNGELGYRTLNISGLISAREDENELFTRTDVYLGRLKDQYIETGDGTVVEWNETLEKEIPSTYRKKTDKSPEGVSPNNIDSDFYIEKRFRETVMEFLTDGKPKLFKSAPEGNMIVRLTNVSFSPNQTLGRRIYSFSATATEIAECNNENLKKYKFI